MLYLVLALIGILECNLSIVLKYLYLRPYMCDKVLQIEINQHKLYIASIQDTYSENGPAADGKKRFLEVSNRPRNLTLRASVAPR